MCLRPHSVCGPGNPLFSPPFEGVPPALPYQREVPPLGFGYPFGGVRLPSLGSLFQPPTLTGFALQSFSPARRSEIGFPTSSPLSRFSAKPKGLAPAPQRLTPTKPAVPLIATQVVSSGRGQVALLSLWTSRALPPLDRKRASLPSLALSSFGSHDLSIARARNPRAFSPNGLALPLRRGCRPVWPFSPIALPHPLRSQPAADYFFISRRHRLLRLSSHLS